MSDYQATDVIYRIFWMQELLADLWQAPDARIKFLKLLIAQWLVTLFSPCMLAVDNIFVDFITAHMHGITFSALIHCVTVMVDNILLILIPLLINKNKLFN